MAGKYFCISAGRFIQAIGDFQNRFIRPMKKAIILWCLVLTGSLSAQQAFPVKVNKKWGLIDAAGQVILPPVYEAIGEFRHFGHATMQRNGKVGLLDEQGKEVIRPVYEDLKMIDSLRVAVMDAGEWMVVDLQGRTVLEKGYERIRVLKNGFLAFRKQNKWGLVNHRGYTVAEPLYDDIRQETEQWFLASKGGKFGLISAQGKEVIPTHAEVIQLFNDSLFFYKINQQWGAADAAGRTVIQPRFEGFQKLSEHFIKLFGAGKTMLYSIPCSGIITGTEFDNFFPFSRKYILALKGRQLGVLDWCGAKTLEVAYDEIQPVDGQVFRVQREGKWGLHAAQGIELTPLRYDYIAPAVGAVCLVRLNGRFGLLNTKGKEMVAPDYVRIELSGNEAKAYKKGPDGNETLALFEWNDSGEISDNNSFNRHFRIRIGGLPDSSARRAVFNDNNFLLDDFEWFYAASKARWGLRRRSDGMVQIEPKFHSIQVYPEFGFTLAALQQNTRGEFERTSFRFESVFGLVNNQLGRLVTEPVFLDVRMSDFQQGLPAARCVLSDGRHGLVDRMGRVLRKDVAFIGEFQEGLARFALGGELSGSLKPDSNHLNKLSDYLAQLKSPVSMTDYTEYDQLFQKNALLICRDCQWGYIDTLGRIVVQAQYHFARDFVNGVGIVSCDGSKWGMVNRKAEAILPCRYDGVHFLENTDNQIIRVYIQQPKYGLIDTLGRLTVSAIYDEIGSFTEGRLAVKRNGLWGYVDRDGLEVIPCRFRDAQSFSGGLAAVKLGRFWGYIDKLGDIGIGFKWARAGSFHEGLAWVYDNNAFGYIDSSGNLAIPAKFERSFDFQNGVARVTTDGKTGLIDNTGRYALRPKFADMQPFNQHGLALVRFGGKWPKYGMADRSGRLITQQAFQEIRPFREGLAAVRYKNNYGFIDTTGKIAVTASYSKVADFVNGRAAVYSLGRCGYIDAAGRAVTPIEYSKCLDFEQDKAIAYKGVREAHLIDMEGVANRVAEGADRLLRFSEGRGLMRTESYSFYYIAEQTGAYTDAYQTATPFRHGVAVVENNGKWGIIDQRGIAIIPPKYDKIESFENGYAKVRILGFSGLTNLHGELIVQPDYEYITYAGEGLFRVEQGDKIGYFDQQGKWVWDLAQ